MGSADGGTEGVGSGEGGEGGDQGGGTGEGEEELVTTEVVGVGTMLTFWELGWEQRREGGLKEVGVDGWAEADLVELCTKWRC